MVVMLHGHTIYSAGDGLCNPEDIATRARELDQDAIAITDHGTMAGMISFHAACLKEKIKPIIGVEAYVREWDHLLPQPSTIPGAHLILLAKNRKGASNLMHLMHDSFATGKQSVTIDLLQKFHEGIICTTACLYGYISSMICRHGIETGKLPDGEKMFRSLGIKIDPYKGEYISSARRYLRALKSIFHDDLYVEIQNHGLAEQDYSRPILIEMAKTYGIKVVATNDYHYIMPYERVPYAYMSAMRIGSNRRPQLTGQMHIKSHDEMLKLFDKEHVNNTHEVADKVSKTTLKTQKYPPIFDSHGKDIYAMLTTKAWRGLSIRYNGTPSDEAKDRLTRELDTLISLGFADYMLIVADIIENTQKLSKQRVGPGRGSAAGSLVAYCLGITDVDPLKHDLMFERFMSESRFTPKEPDFGVPK